MDDLKNLMAEVVQFRDERDWEQFHNPKHLALALSIESAELKELFLWKTSDQVNVDKVKEELADVFIYALFLAHKYNLNIADIVRSKLSLNATKYPVNKSKGNAKKYDQL